MALQIVEVVKAESTPPQAIVFHIVEVSFHHGGVLWEERTQDSWPSFLN
jgi:hypothetical protein